MSADEKLNGTYNVCKERIQQLAPDSAARARFSSTRHAHAQLKFETDAHEYAHVDGQYCILTPPAVLYMHVHVRY